jgi:hypothetical protein
MGCGVLVERSAFCVLERCSLKARPGYRESSFDSYKDGCAGILLKDGFVLLDQTSLTSGGEFDNFVEIHIPQDKTFSRCWVQAGQWPALETTITSKWQKISDWLKAKEGILRKKLSNYFRSQEGKSRLQSFRAFKQEKQAMKLRYRLPGPNPADVLISQKRSDLFSKANQKALNDAKPVMEAAFQRILPP